MKRYLGIDGVQVSASDAALWFFKVLTITAVTLVICALFSLLAVSRVLGQSLEPLVLWQLGTCVQQPGDRPACVSLGNPVPQMVCEAMKRSLVSEGFPGRPVCARVLVDATE